MKNNWDLLNTDCVNYIIEWKNRLNYFHNGLYIYDDILFGNIYIFITDITLLHIIIFDLNTFNKRKRKKYYDFNGNQYILFPYQRHKIVIYPHSLKLVQYF